MPGLGAADAESWGRLKQSQSMAPQGDGGRAMGKSAVSTYHAPSMSLYLPRPAGFLQAELKFSWELRT